MPGDSHPQGQEEPQFTAEIVLCEFVRVIIFIAYIIVIFSQYPRVSLEAMHEVNGGMDKLVILVDESPYGAG